MAPGSYAPPASGGSIARVVPEDLAEVYPVYFADASGAVNFGLVYGPPIRVTVALSVSEARIAAPPSCFS